MSAPAGYYNLYKRHPAKGGGAPFFLAVGHVLEPAPLSLRIASCVITRFHVTIKKRSRNPALSSFPRAISRITRNFRTPRCVREDQRPRLPRVIDEKEARSERMRD